MALQHIGDRGAVREARAGTARRRPRAAPRACAGAPRSARPRRPPRGAVDRRRPRARKRTDGAGRVFDAPVANSMTRIADSPTDPPGPPGPEPECPPDWRTGPPDFVGIGAYRSGTTWLYEMIAAHPDVAIPPGRPKELHFFESFWEGGFTPAEVARYHRYFPRPAGKLVGEWTPRYMFDSWTPRMLAVAAPEARLLVVLRDPVVAICLAPRQAAGRGAGPRGARTGGGRHRACARPLHDTVARRTAPLPT